MNYHPPADIHPAARDPIERIARHLAATPRWAAPGDRQDVTQQLALRAVQITPQYDPSRGSPLAFFERALSNHLRDLRARANAGCRDWKRTVSFENPDELLDRERADDLRLDVRQALTAAPEPLREFARELGRDTLAGAARTLGLSRQQARDRQRLLAEHFSRLGLHPHPRRAA